MQHPLCSHNSPQILKGKMREETCGGTFDSGRERPFIATSNYQRINILLHSANQNLQL